MKGQVVYVAPWRQRVSSKSWNPLYKQCTPKATSWTLPKSSEPSSPTFESCLAAAKLPSYTFSLDTKYTKCFVSIHRATFFFFCLVENQFQSAVVYRTVSHFKIYRSCMNISGDFQWTVVTDFSKCRISCFLRHNYRVFLAIILTLVTEGKKEEEKVPFPSAISTSEIIAGG